MGFYAIYRIVAFADLYEDDGRLLFLAPAGLIYGRIAEALFISENTVKFHVKNILKKTECPKRTDVVNKFQMYS